MLDAVLLLTTVIAIGIVVYLGLVIWVVRYLKHDSYKEIIVYRPATADDADATQLIDDVRSDQPKTEGNQR